MSWCHNFFNHTIHQAHKGRLGVPGFGLGVPGN